MSDYTKCDWCRYSYPKKEGIFFDGQERDYFLCSRKCANELENSGVKVYEPKKIVCFCLKEFDSRDKIFHNSEHIVNDDEPYCQGCSHFNAYKNYVEDSPKCDYCKNQVFGQEIRQLTKGGPKTRMKFNKVNIVLKYLGVKKGVFKNEKITKKFEFCSKEHAKLWFTNNNQNNRKGVVVDGIKFYQPEWFEKDNVLEKTKFSNVINKRR